MKAVRLFIVDAEHRALRPATIKYYRNETGMFRRWLVSQNIVGGNSDFISQVIRQDIENYVDYL